MTDETEQVSAVPSPGELLLEARKRSGLSDADIAERMNLKVGVIQAIDRNDFDALPNAIFVRGYLKAYARLVGLEAAPVLEAYDQLGGKELDTLDMQSFSRRTSRERSNSRIMWITYAIVAFSLGLVVLWWWQKYQTQIEVTEVEMPATQAEPISAEPQLTSSSSLVSETAAEPVEPQTSPELALPEGNTPTTDVEQAESSQPEQVSQPEVEEVVDVSAEVVAEPEEAATTAVALAEVALTFTHDCWIRVEDATGEIVAEGVKTPARVVRFSGQPPFKAIFGLPSAVTVEYQGEPMSFEVQDPKRPLRLTIPKSE